MKSKIKQITERNLDFINPLAIEAQSEGYGFVQRTIDEWNSGINTFSKRGEILFGIFILNSCMGIGGLNVDPYIDDPSIGRIRHLYISRSYRRKGLATQLLNKIILLASKHFNLLRLYTENPSASLFYESIGFTEYRAKKVTHILRYF
jgi:GNAT superfamily N-acetyltransferase